VVVYGDGTWASSAGLGTANAVFIEDNTFINCKHSVSSNNGSHIVVRYNLIQYDINGQQALDTHGGYWGSDCGTRAFEFYNNTIELPDVAGSERAICIRGGEGVIFNNTTRGYDYAVLFRVEDGQTTTSYPLPYQPKKVYVWNNTSTGQNVGYSNVNNTTTYIKQNRDWFASAMSGYTPYQYPHPLVSGSASAPATNQPPAASGNSYATAQNTKLTVSSPGVLSNDSDPEGHALTAAVSTNCAHGSLALSSNGSFTYTPTTGYKGSDSFTYKCSDGTSSSTAATVTIAVATTANQAPVAAGNSYATALNTKLTVAAPGVLGNDSDPEGAALSAVLSTNCAHGSLTLSSNGSFTYTPTTGYTGSDSFTYKASDGVTSSAAVTVTITINAASSSTTFGLSSGNSVRTEPAGGLNAMRFLNSTTGTLTKLQLLIDDTSPTGKVRLGVYADDNGAPGSRLLDAGEVTVVDGWVTISGLSLSVSGNKYYWLSFILQNDNAVSYQQSQPSGSHARIDRAYGSLPSSFASGGTANSNQYVMRATVN
jgi:VCBS repeat-containing protein